MDDGVLAIVRTNNKPIPKDEGGLDNQGLELTHQLSCNVGIFFDR